MGFDEEEIIEDDRDELGEDYEGDEEAEDEETLEELDVDESGHVRPGRQRHWDIEPDDYN